MNADDDLIDEIIARLARDKGVALKRDDPLLEVVLLNQVCLERYLEQARAPITAAFAETVQRAQQDFAENAREQARYVDQVMLKDREKFVIEQKAALDALDSRLLERDAALVKLMADILEKGRVRFAAEVAQANEKPTGRRLQENKERVLFAALVVGMALGAASVVGAAWLGIGQ